LLTASMSRLLDARIAFRFSIVVAGAMLATGRRTAANWFRRAGVKDDRDRFYELLQSIVWRHCTAAAFATVCSQGRCGGIEKAIRLEIPHRANKNLTSRSER